VADVSRIGLIGDVHAEHRRLDSALSFLTGSGVDVIACTGDIADGPGSIDICLRLLAESNALVVAGNHDRWLLEDRVRDVPHAHRREQLSTSGRRYLEGLPTTTSLATPLGDALLCHGVGDNDLRKVWPGSARMAPERSHELDAVIDSNSTRLVLNGHLHYRVIVNFESLTLINAGTLKGEHRPGISILDLAQNTVTAFEFTSTLALHVVAERRVHGDNDRRVWRDTQEFDGHWQPVTLYAS
jgi:predicted phosphodiesterase